MSASTLERFLKRGRKTLKGLSTTKRAKFFRYKIPIIPENGKLVNVGHVAADTVAHCGDKISGSYVWSITMTDRLTGWTENRAFHQKTARNVVKAMHSMESGLPFRIRSIQTDCGTEFLNYTVLQYWQQRPSPVLVSRSRPYHKNDNAHVEQKNFTHVREVFGYERIEDQELVDLMNEIYRDYWNPLHNFFLPQMQLLTKERVGSKITKKHDFPKTPYERLKLCKGTSEEGLIELERRYKSMNPFELKKGLERKLDLFLSLLRQKKSAIKAD
jgi:IS30 family transposase